MKKINIAVILVLYFILPLSAQTVVSISPPVLEVTSPGTISIQVNVSNVTDIHSASVTIEFDSTVIRFASITKGTFLLSNPDKFPVYMDRALYPNNLSPNKITVDQAILGESSASGSGLLFTINFKTNRSGTSPLNITDVKLFDTKSVLIPASSESGYVKSTLTSIENEHTGPEGHFRHDGHTSNDGHTGSEVHTGPDGYYLSQNYPNPFNPVTTISYQMPSAGLAEINIYDLSGRLIRNLVRSEMNRGSYSVIWDGKDDHGSSVSSGTYIYELKTGSLRQSRKMLYVK